MSSGATGVAPARNCAKCGKPLELGSRFCNACGAAVGPAESPTIGTARAPGKDLFVEAIKLSLEKGSGIPAMPVLQKALALGLAPGDEVFARHALGEGYREIFGNSGLPWRKMVETNEFHQCMAEIEKAFELDCVGSLGFFSQPLNI